eukprot:764217-Hanusia_phi.AAC.3
MPKFGDPCKRKWYKGLPQPEFFRQDSAEAFQDIEMFEDDILACSFPKCGTTWLWRILNCLVHMKEDGTITATHNTEMQVYPEWLPLEPQEQPHPLFDFFARKGRRIIASHSPPWMLPRVVKSSGCKVVYIMRNPKDAAVSYANMGGLPPDGWDGSFERFIDPKCPHPGGSYFTYFKEMEEWLTNEVPGDKSHIMYFENVKRDQVAEVTKLARFLNIELSETRLKKVLELTSFENMKSTKAGFLLRKGDVGEWKEWFSETQNKRIDEAIGERLQGSKFANDLTYEFAQPLSAAGRRRGPGGGSPTRTGDSAGRTTTVVAARCPARPERERDSAGRRGSPDRMVTI